MFSKLRSYLYDGALGKYHFDENGDEIGIQVELRVVKNGLAVKLN
jgi:hypothetical protein